VTHAEGRLDQVAVVGAGTMGHGIAQVAAMAGARVSLIDRDPAPLDQALERIRAHLSEGVRRGKVPPALAGSALDRIATTTDLPAGVAGARLVIEAVPERLPLKQDVLRSVEAAATPDTVLASNTSSLSITEIQGALNHPARVVGLHFFNPVHLMQLVEVVRGDATGQATVEAAAAFARWIGKVPIVVRDSPGFASSRLGLTLGLEAMRMLEEGVASAEDIDTAMTLGYRHPMGPLRLTDLVGLDVRLDIAEYLYQRLGDERFRPPRILREKVARGELGRKTGRGFYDWPDSTGTTPT
jgi:3-hydroxybutyryl-CoA dehydrogenase